MNSFPPLSLSTRSPFQGSPRFAARRGRGRAEENVESWMESSSGVARKTHNLQRRNGSRNESSRYTKRPLNEGRWKVARYEAKREIRMVGRPAGTERLPNVIEIYLAVISLFLPLGRPDVSRSPYIKERGGADRSKRPMSRDANEDMPLDTMFRPRVRSSNERPSYELKGRKGGGGWHGG